jgi:hypothetical protein
VAPCERIGSEIVQGDVSVEAFTAGTAFRLTFDDTGTFDVSADDRTIVWYPGPAASDAAVRADLLGRVMALAAHADGRFALHASAVSIDGHAVAFLGPKHVGKSTLALALVRQGARLVADDSVVVRLDTAQAPRAAVGIQRPRLWNDVLGALEIPAHAVGEKPTVGPLPPDRLERAEVPLVACYVLSPTVDGAVPIARSARQTSVHAALTFLRFAKLGALLGGREAPIVLDRAGALATRVPAFTIDVVRDLGLLERVAARLHEWHVTSMPNETATA